MDVLINIIGFLGLGALIIAAWVFASSAKRYITGEDLQDEMKAMESDLSPYRHWKDRSDSDRRKQDPANVFPLIINGMEIKEDRRVHRDRRHAA
ncbi:hypothetical protein R0135_07880 [Congregibacter variabilis]|uniref:Uncharacterized protein n=1 Tax=Congregibacter variabilis TaxID=3081200 RepID=A0ABZ0I7G3_9GAMM|nr:hypothetical protein R0135_07880 [Congregibacter sp. IMCC43200]